MRRIINLIKSYKDEFFRSDKPHKNDFAILSLSFIRDIERSLNLYLSFEQHFLDKSVPFFIIVPEIDLENFRTLFLDQKQKGSISNMPQLLTERETLGMAGEPIEKALSMRGYYVQQIIKLCFGHTKLAKHDLILDSDLYFTKDFDKACLYKNKKLKFPFHEVWHRCRTIEEMTRLNEVGHGDTFFKNLGISFFDAQKTIKLLLKSTDVCFRNYVASATVFDSEVIHSMKDYLRVNGLQNFTNIIRMIPFEFQWYGEYLKQYFELIPMPSMFLICEAFNAVWRVKKGYDADPNKYGIQYQSVDYNNNIINKKIRPIIVFEED